jgi:outer membrane protein OmpA-like peptidoglycan-associated protein
MAVVLVGVVTVVTFFVPLKLPVLISTVKAASILILAAGISSSEICLYGYNKQIRPSGVKLIMIKRHKMKKLFVLFLAITYISAGCATMQENPKTTIGAATGAVLGAGVGYGLGKGKGAAIGAVVGGLAGGAIGHYMDKQKREFDQMLAESQGREQAAIMQGVQKEQDALILTFKSDVLFDTNSSTIKQTAYSSGEIDRVAQILNRYPDTTLKVVGYTDSTGSEEHNQQLSELRANAVKNALVIKGVNAARLMTMGMGESSPIADNSTEAGRQLNRRVNIVISPIQQQAPPPQGQPQPQS